MRHALIASLALMAALLVAATASGGSGTAAAAAGIPGCEKEKLGLLDSGSTTLTVGADDTAFRPGSAATEDQAVEGQRPLQRPGL